MRGEDGFFRLWFSLEILVIGSLVFVILLILWFFCIKRVDVVVFTFCFSFIFGEGVLREF